jgi:hypothetical protein
LVDEIKRTPAPVILVSSEDLCRLRLKDVKRACRFLEEFNVRAVSYLRDPFERMHSDYTQRLRAGRYYPSFAEFIDAEQHLLVNYDDFVGFWDECIGEENVTIRSFENVRQSGGLEMDFASLLIEDYNSLSEFVSQKRLNSSPNPGASDRLRLVNRIEHALGRPSWMRRGFSGIRRLAGGNGIAAGLIGTCTSPERSNPAEERQQVGELSATSYERLARRAERHPAPLRPGAG